MDKNLENLKILTNQGEMSPVNEWLDTVPEEYRQAAVLMIYECLEKKLPLYAFEIQRMVRKSIVIKRSRRSFSR